MRNWILGVVGAVLVACSQAPASSGGGGGGGSTTATQAMRVLETGTASGLGGSVGAIREIEADDANTWQGLYQLHRPGAAVPAVDFTRERVVGIELVRPTTGFGVDLIAVTSDATGVTVSYEETTPATSVQPIAQLTQPFFFAAIPIGNAVRFQRVVVQAP